MPLLDNDIELLSNVERDRAKPGGGFERVRELKIRIRGIVSRTILIPEKEYSPSIADQAILYVGADEVALLEKYPIQG